MTYRKQTGFALALCMMTALSTCAQSPAPPAREQTPAFDVTSVKLNPTVGGRHHIWSSSSDGNFRTENVTLKEIVQWAYDLPETQVLNVPASLADKKFDVNAKSDEATEALFHKGSSDEGKARKQQMVQALLADRFHLVAHRETRELPIYGLVVAKGGSKLTPNKNPGQLTNRYYGKLVMEGASTNDLARDLALIAGRVVEDKTGIDGRFDITLQWTPDTGPAMMNGAPIPDPPPDLFTAIQEQLGLKLESQKGPVEVLVVDRVELPTEN